MKNGYGNRLEDAEEWVNNLEGVNGKQSSWIAE